MKQRLLLCFISSCALFLTACTNLDHNQRAAVGSGIGAVAGGVIGHQLDDRKGRYVGAVAGALTGAALGNQMDKTQQEIEQVQYNNQNYYQSQQNYQVPQTYSQYGYR